MIDYRKFRFSKLNTPEFSHLKYLIFWPIYGLVFITLERGLTLNYTYMHCALDDKIPFLEWFIIPYLFWFVYMVGFILYTLLFDSKAFVHFMKLIIITCSISCITYVVYPTAQALRPPALPRDNIFSDIVKAFYAFDMNTNVCPSIHVASSIAILMAAWNSERLRSKLWRAAFTVTTATISLSTLFVKQHSVIDVIWGVILSVFAYGAVYAVEFFKMREKKYAALKNQSLKK